MTDAITYSQGINHPSLQFHFKRIFRPRFAQSASNVRTRVNQRSIHSYGSLCVCKSPYILFSVSQFLQYVDLPHISDIPYALSPRNLAYK